MEHDLYGLKSWFWIQIRRERDCLAKALKSLCKAKWDVLAAATSLLTSMERERDKNGTPKQAILPNPKNTIWVRSLRSFNSCRRTRQYTINEAVEIYPINNA